MKIFSHFFSIKTSSMVKKIFLIFVPLLAAHQINYQNIFLSSLMFLSFSLVASSVYIFNDLIDLVADKAHPRKKLGPFASGKLK